MNDRMVMDETVVVEDTTSSGLARWALPSIAAVACLLFVAGAILFYFGPEFSAIMNSDAAVPVLLADEALRTGRPVPSTWYFGNDEIWTLAPHLFAMPFVAAIGNSTLTLKLGNLLCLGVMLSFLALSIHRVTRSWSYAILVTAGVFAAFSAYQEGLVYSQAAYGWFTALFALLTYLALRIQDEGVPGSSWPGDVLWSFALYAVVLAALTAESPMRAAAYWVAPLVAVTVIFPISPTRSRQLAAWTILAFLAGVWVHKVLAEHVVSQAGVTASFMKPIGEWWPNILRIWVGLPGVTGWVSAPYASLPGALDRMRFCVMALAGVVVLFAPAGNGPGSVQCRFFARISGVMLLVVLAALTVGRLNVDPAATRYLMPPALLSLASFMAILWCRWRTRTWTIAAVAASFVLIFCGAAVMRLSHSVPIAIDRACEAPASVCQLKDALASTGIARGYATYWKGNVTTLASGGQVKVCGVLLKPRLAPLRWLTPTDCFDPPTGSRYFLALDRTELAVAGRAFLISEAGAPDQVLTSGAYEIWIYTTMHAKLDWLQRR